MVKRVGVLTGGGDCPGLNAVIRAVVRSALQLNWDIIGIKNGWKGLVNGEIELLTDYAVSGILPKGGTILGTSRTNPFKNPEDVQKLKENIKRFGIDAVVSIGGDDTLSVALKLYEMGIPVVADLTPSNLHILGDPRAGFAVLKKAGWLRAFPHLSSINGEYIFYP